MSQNGWARWQLLLLAIGQLCALVASLAVLAWLTGRVAGNRWAWSQWLFWVPTPVVFAPLLAGTLLSLRPTWRRGHSRRWRIRVWLILLGLTAIWFATIQHRLLSGAPEKPQGIAIFQWTLTETLNQKPERFTETILGVKPELAIITNAGWAVIKKQRAAFEAKGYLLIRQGPFAIVTRAKNPRVSSVVVNKGHTIKLAALEIPIAERPDAPLRIWLVDLPSDPRASRWETALSLRAMLDSADEPLPDLIIGDLNMVRSSPAVKMLFPDFEHAFEQGGHGFGATFPRERPWLHIDHILLSETWECTRYDIIDPGVGKHRAQMAWIRVRDAGASRRAGDGRAGEQESK